MPCDRGLSFSGFPYFIHTFFFLSCYYYFIIKFLPCHGKGTDLIALESVIAALFQQPRKTTGKWLFCTLNTRGKKKKKGMEENSSRKKINMKNCTVEPV